MAGRSSTLQGSVPSQYREAFDLFAFQGSVPRHLCVSLLKSLRLPRSTVEAIYESSDTRGVGYLTRDGFYKLLALTALAQKGKPVSDKSLEAYDEGDLPLPSLPPAAELKRLSRLNNPAEFLYTYAELIELETLDLEIIPGKKGLVFKHVEYTLTSKAHGSSVKRRYSDFEALHDLLLQRYPYRLIPRMPPKKFVASQQFIEVRRRALCEFINLVCRHPTLNADDMVIFFVTFSGNDVQSKLKDRFKGPLDEFVRSPLAKQARELVTADIHVSMEQTRSQLRDLYSGVSHLHSVMDRLMSRAQATAEDLRNFGKELGNLGCNAQLTMGGDTDWSHIRSRFREMPTVFSSVADRGCDLESKHLGDAFDMLSAFLALLHAYQHLMERREKGVLREHQAAYAKMQIMKKHQGRLQTQRSADEQDIQAQIKEQEGEVSSIETRNFFSLYCIQMETKLICANLAMLPTAVERLASGYRVSHEELFKMWQRIDSTLKTVSTPTTPTASSLVQS